MWVTDADDFPELCIRTPVYRSKSIWPNAFDIMHEKPRPNWWRRFWFWFLLGVRFEKVET